MIYRTNVSICSSSSCWLDKQRSVVANLAHPEQPRTKVESDNEFDPLDLNLSEHNPKVFFLGRRGIGPQKLDGLGL